MANWKRQVGALNSMSRNMDKNRAPSVISKQRAERVSRLVERIKERFNANADNV